MPVDMWTIGKADRLRLPHFPSKFRKRGVLAFAHIPTGTTLNSGIDISDSKTRTDVITVAPSAIGAGTEIRRATP
jgi:hypothetical protein